MFVIASTFRARALHDILYEANTCAHAARRHVFSVEELGGVGHISILNTMSHHTDVAYLSILCTGADIFSTGDGSSPLAEEKEEGMERKGNTWTRGAAIRGRERGQKDEEDR